MSQASEMPGIITKKNKFAIKATKAAAFLDRKKEEKKK